MKKQVLMFLLALVSLALVITPNTLADEGEIRKIEVDLKVKGLASGEWKDNLESKDINFGPNDQYQYQITVKNLGNRTQTKINVTQKLPSAIKFVSGDSVSWKAGEVLNWKIEDIHPGEQNVKVVTVAVKDKTAVEKELIKRVSTVSAKTEVGTTASDSAYIFTNMGTKNASGSGVVLPETGGNTLVLGSAIALLALASGFYFRKFARGY